MADSPGGHGGAGGSGSHDNGGGDLSPQSNVREHDRFLPIANIGRIMKKALPANGKIAKDAKDTVQECVSEFISFVTSEASDKCQKEKRKTVNGDDLLWAMATLGFEDYIAPLKVYLARYRELERVTPKDLPGALMGPQRRIWLELSWVLMHSSLIKVLFPKVSATQTLKLNFNRVLMKLRAEGLSSYQDSCRSKFVDVSGIFLGLQFHRSMYLCDPLFVNLGNSVTFLLVCRFEYPTLGGASEPGKTFEIGVR